MQFFPQLLSRARARTLAHDVHRSIAGKTIYALSGVEYFNLETTRGFRILNSIYLRTYINIICVGLLYKYYIVRVYNNISRHTIMRRCSIRTYMYSNVMSNRKRFSCYLFTRATISVTMVYRDFMPRRSGKRHYNNNNIYVRTIGIIIHRHR